MDILEIGPCPADEDCQQLGPNYDARAARIECEHYIDQLRRQFGPEPNGCKLYIKRNPCGFGPYLEVGCKFNEKCERCTEYAFKCEGEAWPHWDNKSLDSLAQLAE